MHVLVPLAVAVPLLAAATLFGKVTVTSSTVALFANGGTLGYARSVSADNRTLTLFNLNLPTASQVAVVVTQALVKFPARRRPLEICSPRGCGPKVAPPRARSARLVAKPKMAAPLSGSGEEPKPAAAERSPSADVAADDSDEVGVCPAP